jgi:hypothetical protein
MSGVSGEKEKGEREVKQEDKKIIECAKSLICAINESGKSVLRPDVNEDGFGALTIWIHNGREIEIEYGIQGNRGYYSIAGSISDVK